VNSISFDNNSKTLVPIATARDEPQFMKLDEEYKISKVPLTQRIIFNDKYDNDNSFSQDKIECSFENYHHQHRLVKREYVRGSSSQVNWCYPDVQEGVQARPLNKTVTLINKEPNIEINSIGDDCKRTRNLLKLLKPTKKDIGLALLP
jgi:hypothetical protein